MKKIDDVEGMHKHAPTGGGGVWGHAPKTFFRNECSEIEYGTFCRYFYTFQSTTENFRSREGYLIVFYSNPGQPHGGPPCGGIWPTRAFKKIQDSHMGLL